MACMKDFEGRKGRGKLYFNLEKGKIINKTTEIVVFNKNLLFWAIFRIKTLICLRIVPYLRIMPIIVKLKLPGYCCCFDVINQGARFLSSHCSFGV